MRPPVATLLVVLPLLALVTRKADACSLLPIEPFAGEPDGTQPGGLRVDVKVSRARFGCPGEPIDSCGDLASVQLLLAPVDGATLPPAVRVVLGEGAPMQVPVEGPMLLRADDDGTARVVLFWADGRTFEQEKLDFSVTVTPHDGDDGPSTLVRVGDPGRTGPEPCSPPIVDAVDAGSQPPLSGNDPEEEPGVPPNGCGCSGALAWLPGVGLLARRRRPSPGASRLRPPRFP